MTLKPALVSQIGFIFFQRGPRRASSEKTASSKLTHRARWTPSRATTSSNTLFLQDGLYLKHVFSFLVVLMPISLSSTSYLSTADTTESLKRHANALGTSHLAGIGCESGASGTEDACTYDKLAAKKIQRAERGL